MLNSLNRLKLRLFKRGSSIKRIALTKVMLIIKIRDKELEYIISPYMSISSANLNETKYREFALNLTVDINTMDCIQEFFQLDISQ